MEKNNRRPTRLIFSFMFIASLIILYKILDNFSDIKNMLTGFLSIISPVLVGIFISYILYIPCKKLEKTYDKSKIKFISNKSRILSVFSTYLLVVLVITLVVQFVFPILYINIVDLINSIPAFYNYVIESTKNIPENSFLNSLEVQEGLYEFFNKYLTEFVNMENLGQYAKNVFGIVTSLFRVFVSIVVSIYVLLERRSILNFLDKLSSSLLEKNVYEKGKKYFNKANEIFFTFIGSKCLDSIINGIVVTILLLLFNVKYALLLGIMSGLFNLIPYFGSIVACVIISIITIFTGGLPKAATVLLVLIIFQQTDANIIEPRIMKSSLKISPLLVIFSVMVGGAYFGIIGMFLGVPVITILKVILIDCIESKQNSKE